MAGVPGGSTQGTSHTWKSGLLAELSSKELGLSSLLPAFGPQAFVSQASSHGEALS